MQNFLCIEENYEKESNGILKHGYTRLKYKNLFTSGYSNEIKIAIINLKYIYF